MLLALTIAAAACALTPAVLTLLNLREYLPPPTVGKLADLDPAMLVTPPKGMEAGYVPIATRQELESTPR